MHSHTARKHESVERGGTETIKVQAQSIETARAQTDRCLRYRQPKHAVLRVPPADF